MIREHRIARRGAALRVRSIPLVALGALAAAGPAQARQHHDAGSVGDVRFEVSCDPAVRADFDRAVAMLHHMMYAQALTAFEAIAARDPRCGMAHWGAAMTLFHPLWSRPPAADVLRGAESIRKAKELGATTPRERALLEAAEAFYADPGKDEWWPRLQRWADALAAAHRAHPDDTEIGAFYALSQLAAGQVAQDRPAYHARAAAALLRIHERSPEHPGAVHYTIHANDVTGRADTSLDIVRSYDQIAPSVPHALHMPTHIFVRLGDWPGVIEWNVKSAAAALKTPAGDRISLHYPHAMDYLLYAHLQRRELDAARAVLEETLKREKYEADHASAFHLAAMPARFAVERRAWVEAAALEPRTPAYVEWDRYVWAEALTWFARGLGAAHTGDRARAGAALQSLVALRDRAKAAGEQNFAAYIETDRLILEGAIAQAAGDAAAAVALTRQAAELEGQVQKHPVTPGAVLPPYEALGELLLELGRSAEALAAFEASLERWPARYNSLAGAARAARAAGDAAKASAYEGKLAQLTGG